MVGWGLTDRCNLWCAHCYSSAAHKAGDELPTREILSTIDALAALGTERIGWTGGEPLLRTDLEVLVRHALAGHGIPSGITTNGVLLDERRANSLREAGMGFVQISLDGSTADRNHAIRGASPSAFERVVGAVAICQTLGFDVHLAMLLSAATLDDAPAMLEMARSMRVKSLRFCGFVPWGYAQDPKIRARHDLTGHQDEVRELVQELSRCEDPMVLFDPAFGPLPPDYEYHECLAGLDMLYVTARGDVTPCTALVDPAFRVGNLRERSMREIWDDPEMTRVACHRPDSIEGRCADCTQRAVCHGGCRGIAYAATGSLNAEMPGCLLPAVGAASAL
jgi:radical SAM protein with 4Fe4S-binding SPASM domain